MGERNMLIELITYPSNQEGAMKSKRIPPKLKKEHKFIQKLSNDIKPNFYY